MHTLFEIIRRSEDYLAKAGLPRARREAEQVIADALGVKRLDLYLQFERPMIEAELLSLRTAIQRRSKREPPVYISGKLEFADLQLTITSDVLIPRPETEILIEKIAQKLKTMPLENKVLWDVCCGSGCIGLALKKRFPELEVVLADLSEKALEVARKNALANGIGRGLGNGLVHEFKLGNLFEPFVGQQCDFFVCNPPYVTEAEYQNLDPELFFEPKMALVSGPNGLEFYQRIARELKAFLKPQGLGWLEIGTGQGAAIQALFEAEKLCCHYEPDWSGHDRFFFIENF